MGNKCRVAEDYTLCSLRFYHWTPRLLLVLFINSTLGLFTDDAKRLRALRSNNECLAFQSYIDNLNTWSETYKLKFNVLTYDVSTRTPVPILFGYTLRHQDYSLSVTLETFFN